MIGTRIAHYEITSHLGKGGMGEVYQATDSKLGRNVAIKLLPAAFASDPDRLSRFRREAQVLASLNHPNIAQIYGLEESGDTRCIVMELVEGEPLQARIQRGPIPADEAIVIANQICEALEAAHDHGVVHRDLKPGNVMLARDGRVKVLDFGLAKSYGANPSSAVLSNSPTLASMAATNTGIILGTAAYMSPEQARGELVDKRADIWAFGVVLFEMLIGQQVFEGRTVSDVLASVLLKEPDFSKAPPKVRRLLRRCLEKDPKKRLRDIADAIPLLEEEGTPATVPDGPPAASPASRIPWIVATLLFLITAAAAFGWWRATQPVEQQLVRLDVDLGSDVSLATPNGTSNVIISPDGSRLVYLAAVAGGPPKLFVRRFDQAKANELPGTQGANSPFFSPDGQWIGFTVGSRLNKISIEGGAAIPIVEVGASTGSSWGEDGNIIHSVVLKSLSRVASGGGNATSLAELATGELTFAAPQVLPGNKGILVGTYHETTEVDNASIEVLTPADHRRTVVARGGVSARYVATSTKTGYLVYTNKATLFAVPVDLEHLDKRGSAVAVLDDVGFNPITFEAQYDVSHNGTLVYRKATASTGLLLTTIQWVDASGKKTPAIAKADTYNTAHLSPDGKRIAASFTQDVRVYDLQRETWTDLTLATGRRFFYSPIWSPDSQSVFFGTVSGIAWARADGASQLQYLTPKQGLLLAGSFAPDGKRLAFFDPINGREGQIFTASMENTSGQWKAGTPEAFPTGPVKVSAGWPAFSPDGKWLAYQSNSSATTDDVYVRAFPDNGGQWKVSTNGGQNPIWSRSGHELLYQSGNQEMAVSYSVQGSTFIQEKPRLWVDKVGGLVTDISQDGKRLLVLSQADSPDAAKADHEVVLIQNFFDELRRRVPAGK